MTFNLSVNSESWFKSGHPWYQPPRLYAYYKDMYFHFIYFIQQSVVDTSVSLIDSLYVRQIMLKVRCDRK